MIFLAKQPSNKIMENKQILEFLQHLRDHSSEGPDYLQKLLDSDNGTSKKATDAEPSQAEGAATETSAKEQPDDSHDSEDSFNPQPSEPEEKAESALTGGSPRKPHFPKRLQIPKRSEAQFFPKGFPDVFATH